MVYGSIERIKKKGGTVITLSSLYSAYLQWNFNSCLITVNKVLIHGVFSEENDHFLISFLDNDVYLLKLIKDQISYILELICTNIKYCNHKKPINFISTWQKTKSKPKSGMTEFSRILEIMEMGCQDRKNFICCSSFRLFLYKFPCFHSAILWAFFLLVCPDTSLYLVNLGKEKENIPVGCWWNLLCHRCTPSAKKRTAETKYLEIQFIVKKIGDSHKNSINYRSQLIKSAINDHKVRFQQHFQLIDVLHGAFWALDTLMLAPREAHSSIKLAGVRWGSNRRNRGRDWCCNPIQMVSKSRLLAIYWWFWSFLLFRKIHFGHITIIIHQLLNLIPDLSKKASNLHSSRVKTLAWKSKIAPGKMYLLNSSGQCHESAF